jgi:NAD(P)-dependent dehydrogenase (short-subunit alcohol dehydrogenase family)
MSSVVVTGTSAGIGSATALLLGRAGHTVYATMRNPSRASQLQATISKEKLPVEVHQMDVNSDQSVASAISRILSKAGSVDALINNAGIARSGSVEDLSMDDFKAVMETNYFGALRCIRALLPRMRERRNGCIINVTSVAGRLACTPLGPYTASKFALEALSEVLAQEVKPFNIRVAIVEPGIIDTAMARQVGTSPGECLYPYARRFAGLFRASLATPTSPAVVAEAIRGIIENGSWQLRYPVGPDATPFLEWRASMTNEEWVDWGTLEDDAWYQRVNNDFGLDARNA